MRTYQSPHRWIIEPLTAHHNRVAFSCGNSSLDRYLKQQAGQDARRRLAAPFVLVEQTGSETILGYYALSALGIDFGELPEKIAKKIPHYPLIPATLLGRLAVDLDNRDRGLGELLVMDALHRAFIQSKAIASAIVVVDAANEPAWRFYRHLNFVALPQRHDRLFLAMKTIARLFPDD